jgi:hypothetical protein
VFLSERRYFRLVWWRLSKPLPSFPQRERTARDVLFWLSGPCRGLKLSIVHMVRGCSIVVFRTFGLILQYDTIRVINKLRLVIQERIAYLTPRS